MIYLSHSRTALLYLLKNINLSNGDNFLVPDYNCSAIYQPLSRVGVKCNYYSIKDNFEPNWEDIYLKINTKTKAILMVHYFGQPQNIEKFMNFCKENKILLLEDNSHGYGGFYNNKLLGTFGDFGISSPRKILNLTSGGIGYSNTPLNLNTDNLEEYPNSILKNILNSIFRKNPKIKEISRKYLYKRPNFNNPLYINEPLISSYKIDSYSLKILKQINLEKIRVRRIENWKKWNTFGKKNNFQVVWPKPHSTTCPWIIPFYLNDIDQRNYWLNKSWNEGLGFMSWPTLPKEIISRNDTALNRWKRLICINLNFSPDYKK